MSRIWASNNALRYRSMCVGLLCLLCGAVPSLGQVAYQEEVGFNTLAIILAGDLPSGASVPISQVEATFPGGTFTPNTALGQFNGITFTQSPPLTQAPFNESNGISSHATQQAGLIYGSSSVAQGVDDVTLLSANRFFNFVLNANLSGGALPDLQDVRVQNFSLIGGSFVNPNNPPSDAVQTLDREILRRFDYSNDVNNITAVVGLGNNANTLIPGLLASSYNSIAVGRSDGQHSQGLTVLEGYGPGRSRPDIVSPLPTTSTATSSVSSVATFLHSVDEVRDTDAANSEVIKAILLAGATKDEFPEWSRLDDEGIQRPLDDTYGAGQVNLLNSYLITQGGRTEGSTGVASPVTSYGWDYQTILPDDPAGESTDLLYEIVIPEGGSPTELSVVLAWNAQIDDSSFDVGEPIVADLNLELVDANGVTVDLDLSDALVDGLSASEVDNVEHIYIPDLAAGSYTLIVSNDDENGTVSDFGLAWRASTDVDNFSVDLNSDNRITGADFLASQIAISSGTLDARVGDVDGDLDVDADDLAIISTSFSPGTITQPSAVAVSAFAVPEPASWLLTSLLLLILSATTRIRLLSSVSHA